MVWCFDVFDVLAAACMALAVAVLMYALARKAPDPPPRSRRGRRGLS